MKKLQISTDRLLALSAIMISLLTLIIFIYQTSLIREQSRLSVTPRFSFNAVQNVKDTILIYKIELENKGLGPGIIEEIKIVHDNKKYDLDFTEFFDQVYPDMEKYGRIISEMTLGTGDTVMPGEEIRLIGFRIPMSKVEGLTQYLGNEGEDFPFTVEVIYSSIYKEKWKTHLNATGHPIQLN